ncbi:MAG: hypothetical protein A2941_01165 [Candidatus Yanofskybacteria bacterium RIFCSPLOWO2_01_FULL_49_17]|uniref:Uncharacterized protein n=1 Tax=Candidatus Yanofskybacteria bacterium RIFCSPLOWO2_01_FULL_49_17 TaxID=1802700 RepID=A0A1F8GRH1_9BACT|nr:MAG: hypothetical protein A2941_01165 [Candidatus Yanofskybacteria bacterium RIFCSPLOWO2_01_FULL_49_17]
MANAGIKERSFGRLLGIVALFMLAFSAARQEFCFLAVVISAIAGGTGAIWVSHRCQACGAFRTKVVQECVPATIYAPTSWSRRVHCFACDSDNPLPTRWDRDGFQTPLL